MSGPKSKAMIDIVIDDGISADLIPPEARIKSAVRLACCEAGLEVAEPDLCLRFSDDETVRALNRQWRDKDETTDVLSFPIQEGPAYDTDAYLGDIIFSWPYVLRSARALGIDPQAHVLHLAVHGVLHLLGFDHGSDEDAVRMQTRERQVMHALSLHDPYDPRGLG
jgi:probable rRNA maturation factor